MDLYTEINYLFFATENEKIQHSQKMEKLRDLIDKSRKETFKHGKEVGILEAKIKLEELLQSVKKS